MKKRVRRNGLASLVCLGVWAFWLEPSSTRVATYQVAVSTWPAQCDGMTVAVLADLHVGSPFKGLKSLAEIVTLTNAAQPDLVLLAGDYVIQGVLGGTFVPPEDIATELSRLTAKLGVFAVLGNHDWWLGAQRVRRALEGVQIPVLEDEHRIVSWKHCAFTLTGISDFWEGEHNVSKAIAGIDQNMPVLAFTHNPDIFPELPESISLLIAGHTHGGQVNFPWLGRPIVPSQYRERYAIGHVVEAGREAFVSPGLGTSILPVRFRVPPEISLLTLVSGTSSITDETRAPLERLTP